LTTTDVSIKTLSNTFVAVAQSVNNVNTVIFQQAYTELGTTVGTVALCLTHNMKF